MNKKQNYPDFFVRNLFSIIQLIPTNDNAKNWINENLQLENWQSKNIPAIESRYFDAIYEGITNDGLTVQGI